MSNPVIVRRRVQRDFTILPNDVVRDPRLSWKALGLLVYVLSLPDNFRLYLKYLTKQKITGRDGTRSGLKELEVAGYLTIQRERHPSGRFSQVIWEVTDSPASGIPAAKPPRSEKPNTVNSDSDFSKLEKPTLSRTTNKQELIKEEPTTTHRINQKHVVVDDLIWPSSLNNEAIKESASLLIRDCPDEYQQLVLDEISGLAIRGTVRHPIGLLRALIEAACQGSFVPAAALEFRQQQAAEKKAAERAYRDKQHRRRESSPEAKRRNQQQLSAIRKSLKVNS